MPELRIQRMDLDSTRSKNAYQDIIDRFEQHEIDVIIGTQIISKGLHFDDVQLVGIFDADRLIHFPDFRSHERAFQLLTQVGGRAGRKKLQGKCSFRRATLLCGCWRMFKKKITGHFLMKRDRIGCSLSILPSIA